MTVNTIKIQDTGKGAKSAADDLEAVLRKIESWHQGAIAGYRISFRDAQGPEQRVQWTQSESQLVIPLCAGGKRRVHGIFGCGYGSSMLTAQRGVLAASYFLTIRLVICLEVE